MPTFPAPFRAALTIVVLSAPLPAMAQDHGLTDPLAIAAECGGSAAAGAQIFAATCAGCHALRPDEEATLAGPHLGDLLFRPIGSTGGAGISAGLRLLGADGTAWERETLRAYLATGTPSIRHPVVPDGQTLNDLMTYLRIETLPPPPAPGELTVPPEVLAIEGDAAYGAYLASDCAGCHGAGGTIPQIDGLDRTYFITALHEYRARARENETMRNVAATLDDQMIASLAAHFTAD